MRTLALVESPSQLLNVIEWADATDSRRDLDVHILAPQDHESIRQLHAVSVLAADEGIAVTTHQPRVSAAALARTTGRLAAKLPRVDRLVVGDPFSGLLHRLLPLVRATKIVVVDDGTATWEYAACVDSGTALVRWWAAPAWSPAAVRATRAMSPRPGRRVTVFTALHDAAPQGAGEVRNRYAWTRRHADPLVLPGEAQIIGASLVESGLVHRDAYIDAVTELSRRYGASRYLAHRRESEDKLSAIASAGALQIERPRVPVEFVARAWLVAEHVITFPSTAAHTLPIVLAGTAAQVRLQPVEKAWFTAEASEHARRFVQRMTDRAAAELIAAA
jgi:hypothetical protein